LALASDSASAWDTSRGASASHQPHLASAVPRSCHGLASFLPRPRLASPRPTPCLASNRHGTASPRHRPRHGFVSDDARPGMVWHSLAWPGLGLGIRNSRKEHMVEPAEPARPDSLGNRASIPGHLATSVGPPVLGTTSGPSNQARRAGWVICAFNPGQPAISAGELGQHSQTAVSFRRPSRPCQPDTLTGRCS